MFAFRLGIDEVDVESALVDLPHIQGCILLQAFLQLSLAITLFLHRRRRGFSVRNQGPALVALVNVGRDCTFLEIRLRA
jgi:hypothetical protein